MDSVVNAMLAGDIGVLLLSFGVLTSLVYLFGEGLVRVAKLLRRVIVRSLHFHKK